MSLASVHRAGAIHKRRRWCEPIRLCAPSRRRSTTDRDDNDEMRRQHDCSRGHGIRGAAVDRSFSCVSINRKSPFGVAATNVPYDDDELRTTAWKRGWLKTTQKHVLQPATTRLNTMTRLLGLAITTVVVLSCANGAPAAPTVWDGPHDNAALKPREFSRVTAGMGLTALHSSPPSEASSVNVVPVASTIHAYRCVPCRDATLCICHSTHMLSFRRFAHFSFCHALSTRIS